MGKKQQVLLELFTHCQKRRNYVFDNDLVESICKKVGFKNKFDVTKVDHERILPEELRQRDYALIHLGKGRHQFIKGIAKVYHQFEPIREFIDWPYRKSLLNEYNSSESNILSVANNQRILHNFLYGLDKEFEQLDIFERPKTYFPHRTKTDLNYRFGNSQIVLDSIQIEVDLTIEYKGVIGIFEAKNGNSKSFSIYQIYHPFLYYHKAKSSQEIGSKIKEIVCVYVVRRKEKGHSLLSLWAYSFTNPNDITSIKLKQSIGYRLIGQHAD
jgi:hypothetical protein